MEIAATQSDFKSHSRVDRIGIFASILCAIHCALTPVLLILLPTFGKAWAHPSTHWGMAIIVIPIAVFMIKKGFKKHGKKWIVALGAVGIVLIIVGSILPYVETSPKASTAVATNDKIISSTAESPSGKTETGDQGSVYPGLALGGSGASEKSAEAG